MAEHEKVSKSEEEYWVYHEKQVSSLCGQHCINNLVQGAYYTAADLAEIAQELDEKERQHMLSEGVNTPDAIKFLAEDSGNVDEAGNFSVQVLSAALSRRHGLHLVSADSELVSGQLSTTGFSREGGFVLNRHSHWIAIRSVGGTYWDLNSMLDFPARITSFALEATLEQHRKDGYAVFVIRGQELPPAATTSPGRGARDSWYRVKDLLDTSTARGGLKAPRTAATDVWLNSGPGQRLDGGSTNHNGYSEDMAFGVSSEDEQLAMAISASMADHRDEVGTSKASSEGAVEAKDSEHAEEMDDDVSAAISLSLSSDGGPKQEASAFASPAEIYVPQPVPNEEPPGTDVVRVQLRLDGNKRIVRRFRRTDPITTLLDVAAHALTKADGRPLSAPFDIIDPEGKALLTAGRLKVGEGPTGDTNCTIDSERLGGASILVRRAR